MDHYLKNFMFPYQLFNTSCINNFIVQLASSNLRVRQKMYHSEMKTYKIVIKQHELDLPLPYDTVFLCTSIPTIILVVLGFLKHIIVILYWCQKLVIIPIKPI